MTVSFERASCLLFSLALVTITGAHADAQAGSCVQRRGNQSIEIPCDGPPPGPTPGVTRTFVVRREVTVVNVPNPSPQPGQQQQVRRTKAK
jgi:hypothetical protein